MTTSFDKKVIVVTGASSGFGRLAVEELGKAGHTVYAGIRDVAGRNAQAAADLAKQATDGGPDLHSVEMDVTDDASVDAAIASVIGEQGRLDVIVHNAGHMILGPAEAFTPEQYASVFDVNVLAAQRVNRAALPHLREQRGGLVVWVGSTSTRGGCPPFLAPYFGAKAAMDAIAVSSYETACQPLLVGLRLSGLCCVRCGGCGVAGGRGGLASRPCGRARLRAPCGAGRGPGAVGAACRGVVVAVATARLIFACRGRRSAARRTLPLTTREIRLAHN